MMPVLEKEESIEQAFFFRVFRERILDGMPTQEVLARVGEELLSTTRLPMAISFIHSEIKLSGLIAPAMARLSHYFTTFQTFVISRAEEEKGRFTMDLALLILEREARYRAEHATPAGLFVYQFEGMSRNRLGYNDGLTAMAGDPFYSEDWQEFIITLRARLGDVDFADLLFVRSAFFLSEQRRRLRDPDHPPKFPVLFGEKEGKIARAHRGRDPIYLFSALQRQLGYPEVPQPKRPDGLEARVLVLEQKIKELENRLKLSESDKHGHLDLSELTVKPEDTAGVPQGWGRKSLDIETD